MTGRPPTWLLALAVPVIALIAVVKVTNADDTVHTLSARDRSFGTGDLDSGQTATVALNQSGTFSYFCQIHNFMTGTLVVE